MTTRFCLLNDLVKLLHERGDYFEVAPEKAAKMVGISLRTLNKAKNNGNLPYVRRFKGVLVIVDFFQTYEEKGWRVHLKPERT